MGLAPTLPPVARIARNRLGPLSNTKKAETLVLIGDSGLSWTALELELVEVGGIEPPSEGTPSPALHA